MSKQHDSCRWRAKQVIVAVATFLCANFSTPVPSHAEPLSVAAIADAAGRLLSLVSRFFPSPTSPVDMAVFKNSRLMADLHARFDDFEQTLGRTEQAIADLPKRWRIDLKNEFRERDHGALRANFGEIDDYMSVASQGHKPLVSPNIEQEYRKLRENARNLLGRPFDFWNLPILLMAFSYEYRIHHAFEIPKESTLTEELDKVPEELEKLFQEQQHYIKTASEEGKLTVYTGPDGNLNVRFPLPREHEDEVAATLENYTARSKQIESRFIAAHHELQAYRNTVQNELKTIGDRYSTYFNNASAILHNLISRANEESWKQSNIVVDFRVLVLQQFHTWDATDIKLVNSIRHQYSKVLLPRACRIARFTGSGSYDESVPDRMYWRIKDWRSINNALEKYRKELNEKIEEIRLKKSYTENEMKGYSAYLSVVDAKFQILDKIYEVIPPDIGRGRSFDFNKFSVAGSVTTSERSVFQSWIELLKLNLEQRKGVLRDVIDVEYRRVSDSVEGFRDNVLPPIIGEGNGDNVFDRGLGAACCRDYWDDC